MICHYALPRHAAFVTPRRQFGCSRCHHCSGSTPLLDGHCAADWDWAGAGLSRRRHCRHDSLMALSHAMPCRHITSLLCHYFRHYAADYIIYAAITFIIIDIIFAIDAATAIAILLSRHIDACYAFWLVPVYFFVLRDAPLRYWYLPHYAFERHYFSSHAMLFSCYFMRVIITTCHDIYFICAFRCHFAMLPMLDYLSFFHFMPHYCCCHYFHFLITADIAVYARYDYYASPSFTLITSFHWLLSRLRRCRHLMTLFFAVITLTPSLLMPLPLCCRHVYWLFSLLLRYAIYFHFAIIFAYASSPPPYYAYAPYWCRLFSALCRPPCRWCWHFSLMLSLADADFAIDTTYYFHRWYYVYYAATAFIAYAFICFSPLFSPRSSHYAGVFAIFQYARITFSPFRYHTMPLTFTMLPLLRRHFISFAVIHCLRWLMPCHVYDAAIFDADTLPMRFFSFSLMLRFTMLRHFRWCRWCYDYWLRLILRLRHTMFTLPLRYYAMFSLLDYRFISPATFSFLSPRCRYAFATLPIIATFSRRCFIIWHYIIYFHHCQIIIDIVITYHYFFITPLIFLSLFHLAIIIDGITYCNINISLLSLSSLFHRPLFSPLVIISRHFNISLMLITLSFLHCFFIDYCIFILYAVLLFSLLPLSYAGCIALYYVAITTH